MPTRQEFNACISQGMSGKTFTKEERKIAFCATAKLCSGKAQSMAEAQAICSQPKPPKPEGAGPRKRRGKGQECPPFDPTTLLPHCEMQLSKMVKSGELPANTDVPGACLLILG